MTRGVPLHGSELVTIEYKNSANVGSHGILLNRHAGIHEHWTDAQRPSVVARQKEIVRFFGFTSMWATWKLRACTAPSALYPHYICASFATKSIDQGLLSRSLGVTVCGFGERKTNTAFIAACVKFMYFDVLDVEPGKSLTAPQLPKLGILPVFIRNQPIKRPLDQTAITGLARAVNDFMSDNDNWVSLADVGNCLSKISPDLHARNYGYERLREFVEASGIMDLKWKKTGDKPPVGLIHLKRRSDEGLYFCDLK
jgi:hypothetical protein